MEVERFLFREARLLDEHRIDEWLTLWAEDAHHVVRCAPERDAVLDETKPMLAMRAVRLDAVPTTRQITNVEVEGDEDELAVHSVFVAHGAGEVRRGRRTDLLRSTVRSWRILRREVVLEAGDPAGL